MRYISSMSNVDYTLRRQHQQGVAAVKMAFRQVVYEIMTQQGMDFEEARQEFRRRLRADVVSGSPGHTVEYVRVVSRRLPRDGW